MMYFWLRFSLLTGLAAVGCARAQPLNQRVLVVHNTAAPESVSVADYYVAQRSVPSTNRCAITSQSQTSLTMDQYRTIVQAPLRACLYAAGYQKILYVVMTYGVPYAINDARLYSIDSFVADIWDKYTATIFTAAPTITHGYYADAQAEGGYYPPFKSLAEHRSGGGAPALLYSVWRLDGPSAALSKGLVDKAKLAEANGGPAGKGCFDWRVPLTTWPDLNAGNGDWDVFRASQFLRQAGFATVEDENAAEMTSCQAAAFYAGWYSQRYNDIFTWNTGAIGWHLDSSSAAQPRNPIFWAPGAIAKGITVTMGSVSEPYLQGLTRPSGAFRNLLEGANVGDAFLRNTRWLKWHDLFFGDPLYTPFAGGKAPFKGGAATDSLFISLPRSIVGGLQQATGTIAVSTPAPPGGRVFSLTTQYAGRNALIPASVTIPAGQSNVSFPISGSHRTYVLSDLIRATSGSTQLRNSISVTPLLANVRLQFPSVRGGTSLQGAIGLNARAGIGVAVALTSNNPLVVVPPSVAVPYGQTSGAFNVGTASAGAGTSVTITATQGGATATVVLRLTP